MSRKKKVLIGAGIVLVGAAVVGANLYFKKDKGLPVTTEAIKSRDLEAVVSASGKIQPKRLVQISADTPGRVVDLAVNEGDRVKVGQFLLQIDPKSLRTRVESNSAALRAAQQSLDQMRQAIETAKVQLQQAQQNLARQQDLWRQQLTTRESLDKAMNNPGTVLLTLADMSIIQAEVEVDETNIPHVQLGQRAKVTIDAIPDRSFRGHVTEIGNSPIQSTTGGQSTNQSTGTQATNFKVVVVIDEPVP